VELIRESLDHCVKCTICETHCPVSAATPLFPGPKYVGPQAERFRVDDISPDDSLDLCSGCGICTHVCPQGVKIAEINSRARVALKEQKGMPFRDKVAMPEFSGRTFRGWARRHPSRAASKQVVYFHGCSTNYFEPGLGRRAVAVLEHQGYEVIIPKQGCCGLPLQSNGLFDDARAYIGRLAAALGPYARRELPIVATSTSCGLMLKREAREILGIEDDELAVVGAHTYDICEFLSELHDRGELSEDLSPVETTVTYHAPCQQRGHGIGSPALDLFALIPGVHTIPQEAECCGIAGTYGVKKEKYEIAMDVGRPLFDSLLDSGADEVACDSETCRWQISHATRMATIHPIELLHRSYGLG
jgi:glycerol-3-phosphate dehydrogenase subunit C